MQLNQAGRVVTLIAVSQGDIYVAQAGDDEWTEAVNDTGDTPPLNFTGLVYSTSANQKQWFVDGVNWVYYDPFTNTASRWEASAGTLPADSENNTPRLICTWRGRVVLAGLLLDPQNWFMSAVSDPTDFDYSPDSITPTQAIAGNNAPQGLIGDMITSLCPYTDDVLVIFGDHTIYMMRGDPMAGGQIDLISDSIGGAWGICWCKDPYGNIYFFSNRCGIYTLVPGQQPQRISQGIEQELLRVDMGNSGIRLLWDDRFQGCHVFVTPLDEPAASTHFFYEQRTGAWWIDRFREPNHDPLCCCVFDGNNPGDRVSLIGSWDGYVRAVDPEAEDDDGEAIDSSVVIGPLLTKDLDEILLKDVQAVLGETSNRVSYEVFVGPTAEAALATEAVESGTFDSSRNPTALIRRAGHAAWVKLTSDSAWSMEQIRCRVATEGKVRRRGL